MQQALQEVSMLGGTAPSREVPTRHLSLRKEFAPVPHVSFEVATIVEVIGEAAPPGRRTTLRIDQQVVEDIMQGYMPAARRTTSQGYAQRYQPWVAVGYAGCMVLGHIFAQVTSPPSVETTRFLATQAVVTVVLCVLLRDVAWMVIPQEREDDPAAQQQGHRGAGSGAALARAFATAPKLIDSGFLAGTKVWGAAVLLTDELLERHAPALKAGAKVVELGCGLGMPGMVCAALGASAVLTDVPAALGLLERNIAANFGSGGVFPGSVRATSLQWGAAAARGLAAEEGGFDFVLCADCVFTPYYQDSWRELVETLKELCGPRTTALVSVQRRPNDDGVDRFLRGLEEALAVERLCAQDGDGGAIEVLAASQRLPRRDKGCGGGAPAAA